MTLLTDCIPIVKRPLLLAIVLLSACSRTSPSETPGSQEQSTPSSQLPSDRSNQPGTTQGNQAATKPLLPASQALAADLTAADKLQSTYQALKHQFEPKPGRNPDSSFVGIQGMREALRNHPGEGHGNLKKFMAWAKTGAWGQFAHRYHHYDWWMFPIDRHSAGQGWKYTVYQQDIEALKADAAWLRDYRLGAILLMQSWGWDVAQQKPYANLAPGQQWRHWDVRLGKLGHSLILFEQWDLYASLQAYVDQLTRSGIKLEAWVLGYFP